MNMDTTNEFTTTKQTEIKIAIWKAKKEKCFFFVDSLNGDTLNVDFEGIKQRTTRRRILADLRGLNPKVIQDHSQKRESFLVAQFMTGKKVVLR